MTDPDICPTCNGSDESPTAPIGQGCCPTCGGCGEVCEPIDDEPDLPDLDRYGNIIDDTGAELW